MKIRLLPWTPAILLLAGCATVHQQPHARPAIGSTYIAREAGFTAQQQKLADELCFKGMPQKTSDQLGPTEFIFRQGYVLEHSSLDKIPYWVCEHVTPPQIVGNAERSNQFKVDPDLKGPHSTPADYKSSGYDQGHQAPAGNEAADQQLQNETFYLSNMAPQLPNLNRDAWKSLETLTRTWVKQYSEAYEITGPIFYDPKEDNPQTADGTIKFWTIGKDAVSVPTHFYKIIIVKDGASWNKDGASWKSIAFVMPNTATYKSPYHLEQYIQSVQWIEQHTGLNFMPNLTPQQRVTLESHASAMWQ